MIANIKSYAIVISKTKLPFKLEKIAKDNPAKITPPTMLDKNKLLVDFFKEIIITKIDIILIALFMYEITFNGKSTNFNTIAKIKIANKFTATPIKTPLIIEKIFLNFKFFILPPNFNLFVGIV